MTPLAVKDKLDKLKSNKAQGPDQLPPRVLKELSDELSIPLTVLFNKSLESGTLPTDWKTADITAIFKKGTKSDPGNYRPVSLTCVLCKVLESIIRDEIVEHMTKQKLFSDCQHGFRRKRSCITQLLLVMEDLTKLVEEGSPFDIVYFDFKKAFDTVPHQRLLAKLKAYGIGGSVHRWIEGFLKDRKQRVRVGKDFSSYTSVLSGIPQGSILGPILFTIFINDLPDCAQSQCYIFADDTKIYNKSENHDQIQNDIDSFLKWSDTWCLYFNAGKCKVMHAGKKNPEHNYKMKIEGKDDVIILECEEEKDLGVTFDKSLKFDVHIQNCISKANKVLGIIKRSFTYLDTEIFIRLYKSLVRPILEYGNVIWYPYLKRQSVAIEKVQRRATKMLPSLRDFSYEDRLKQMKLPSLKHRRQRGDLIQVYKIFNDIDDIAPELFFTVSPSAITRNTGSKMFVKFCKTNTRKYSFSNRVVHAWNSLAADIKDSTNVNTFKNRLDQDQHFIKSRYEFDT